jgi:hypothetical protein
MVFGRKKKEIEDSTQGTSSQVVNATINNDAPPSPEMTPEEKELLRNVQEYHKFYGSFMGIGDVAQLPSGALKAEQMNILFALYCELKLVRECLERMEKQG